MNNPQDPAYIGRFAPSPTGPMHFGSLVTAVGSYLEARSRHGKWLVRMENLDAAREAPGASEEILRMIEALGMEWDGKLMYQNQHDAAYRAALCALENCGLVYPCLCSRKEIADSSIRGIEGPIYPGTCRAGSDKGQTGARRLKTDNNPIEFTDALHGRMQQRLESDVGDFVLRRADGVFAYQLAVVVDDAAQGVTHVVRGEDLLNSTPRQIYLQRLLGYSTPLYMHLPVVTNARGEKLSKQTGAAPLDASRPIPQLMEALRFLGQMPPAELVRANVKTLWEWAISSWKPEAITLRMNIGHDTEGTVPESG
ncbi:MAG: tRNA glutamyl-Q(34) synthetase GluQRS [Nitrosospira sp. 56-18]|nr:MAG: tRNA glutamyl-Q(34) synthetase GluQRS [Nitrosospira sp. 56-18]